MAEYFDYSQVASATGQYDDVVACPDEAHEALSNETTNLTANDRLNDATTEQQNYAISSMLLVVPQAADLLQLVQSFTAAQDAGHNDRLTIISGIPVEERARRVEAIGQ
jgi:hypothetical protein